MIKIAPSLLSADFSRLKDEIDTVLSADLLHVDVMDGIFVPNISIGLPVVKSLRKVTDKVLDVHLMIDRPVRYIKDFVEAGSDFITAHIEADRPEEVLRAVTLTKELGKKAGIVVKPKTAAEDILPFLPHVDMVLVMTVEPGFGGQSFMYDMLPKIRTIRAYIDEINPACELEIDGGINAETGALCAAAGATILVAGSSVFGAPDREKAMDDIRRACL